MEIIKLKEEIKEKENIIKNLQDTINNLDNQYLFQIDNLKKSIISKDDEIKNLKNRELQKDGIINKINMSFQNLRSQIRAVAISCIDPNITYAIPCFGTDNFSYIENKLYSEFPDLFNNGYKYCFVKGGRILQKSDVIDIFKIGDGKPVQMQSLSNSMMSINTFKKI